jgi:uncharacterized MAPEG superfamily protein
MILILFSIILCFMAYFVAVKVIESEARFKTSDPPGHRKLNQRQIRVRARRAHAAGSRFAFA